MELMQSRVQQHANLLEQKKVYSNMASVSSLWNTYMAATSCAYAPYKRGK